MASLYRLCLQTNSGMREVTTKCSPRFARALFFFYEFGFIIRGTEFCDDGDSICAGLVFYNRKKSYKNAAEM